MWGAKGFCGQFGRRAGGVAVPLDTLNTKRWACPRGPNDDCSKCKCCRKY